MRTRRERRGFTLVGAMRPRSDSESEALVTEGESKLEESETEGLGLNAGEANDKLPLVRL